MVKTFVTASIIVAQSVFIFHLVRERKAEITRTKKEYLRLGYYQAVSDMLYTKITGKK